MKTNIPYDVICNAKRGDEEAIRQILKHYEPIIVDASKRMVRTDKDTMTDIVDDDIRAFIESELVLAIINTYDPYRMPKEHLRDEVHNISRAFQKLREGLTSFSSPCQLERASRIGEALSG